VLRTSNFKRVRPTVIMKFQFFSSLLCSSEGFTIFSSPCLTLSSAFLMFNNRADLLEFSFVEPLSFLLLSLALAF
jgi:hypothetical protein